MGVGAGVLVNFGVAVGAGVGVVGAGVAVGGGVGDDCSVAVGTGTVAGVGATGSSAQAEANKKTAISATTTLNYASICGDSTVCHQFQLAREYHSVRFMVSRWRVRCVASSYSVQAPSCGPDLGNTDDSPTT